MALRFSARHSCIHPLHQIPSGISCQRGVVQARPHLAHTNTRLTGQSDAGNRSRSLSVFESINYFAVA
jgi:hypothetical protein